MPSHEKNDTLLAGGYLIAPFRDLSHTHQLAIVHYLAVDGEAWDWPDAMGVEFSKWSADNPEATYEQTRTAVSRILVNHLEHFVTIHGDLQIGVALVDMDVVKQHVMTIDPDVGSHGSWEAYHAWYKAGGGVPSHPDHGRWPCILSGMEEEVFEDGWHRLHSYAASGHVDLPLVFFPAARHFDHEARMDTSTTSMTSTGPASG